MPQPHNVSRKDKNDNDFPKAEKLRIDIHESTK